ncbi:MAG TPA: hypothetical protein VNG04_08025 [Candidatus Acidoferrum sp.]|nr:hypothetical protein [Candidatus Acidoferrum sp.]
MARFGAAVESQAAQAAGTPSGTTFNGYFAALVAGASQNFKLRRAKIGVRAGASVPTSQQMTVAIYRQSVRAAGTGFSTTTGQNLDPRGASSQATGVDITTATAAGTTGPTIGANPIAKFSFNTQAGLDLPWEMLEELICDQGTANGLAFVNIGNALPASHLFTLDLEWEE